MKRRLEPRRADAALRLRRDQQDPCRRCCGRCRAGTTACRLDCSIRTGSRRNSRKAGSPGRSRSTPITVDEVPASTRRLQAGGLGARARKGLDARRALRAAAGVAGHAPYLRRGLERDRQVERGALQRFPPAHRRRYDARNTSGSSARTITTPASTCRRHCTRRPSSRSASATRSCRAQYGFPMKLRMPTKLGFKNPEAHHGAVRDQRLPGRLLGGPGLQLV